MTDAPEVDVVVLAPLGARGVAANSITFALRALVSAGLHVELIDVTPYEQGRRGARGSSAPILALSTQGQLRFAAIGRMSRPRVLLLMQVGADNAALELLPAFDAPVVIAEAPRPLSGANSAHAQPAVPGDATGVVDCTGLEALASAMRKMTSQQILLIPGHSSGATQLEASLLPPDVAVELEFTSRFGPDVSKSGGVRQLLPGVTPTLGRHSFLKETDWERDPAALKTLLQPTSEFKTLLIGRTSRPRRILSRLPSNWTVQPAELHSVIASIDYWTLGGEHQADELDDLGIEEALASGCVVLLPPDYQQWFGGAAVYAARSGMPARIRKTHSERTSARNFSRRALAFTEKHTARHLLLRVQKLLHPRPPIQRGSGLAGCAARGGARYHVTFVTSNGAGMGHLTRLLAVAKSLPDDVDRSFISFSKAVPIVHTFGYPFTYVMSPGEGSWSATEWNRYAAHTLHREFSRRRPDMIVFDGNWPYKGFLAAAQASGAILVWSLRGLWKSDADFSPLRLANVFDSVITPGDVAAGLEEGWVESVATFKTAPITLASPKTMKSREVARSTLNLKGDGLAVLVSLGAGTINDTRSLTSRVVKEISLLPDPHDVYLVKNPLSPIPPRFGSGQFIQRYPLADILPAFDWLVSAAGYNSVHEALAGGLPGLWIPNDSARTDDQVARARHLRDAGLGSFAEESDTDGLRQAIRRMADGGRRQHMKDLMRDYKDMTGAREAADHLMGLLLGHVP